MSRARFQPGFFFFNTSDKLQKANAIFCNILQFSAKSHFFVENPQQD